MIVSTTVIHDCGRLASYDVTTSTLYCPCDQKRNPTMKRTLPLVAAFAAVIAFGLVAFAPADPAPAADDDPPAYVLFQTPGFRDAHNGVEIP